MKKDISFYKGFDINETSKKAKLSNEYSNPYGYNFTSTSKNVVDENYRCTHTNQDNKRR